MVKMEDLVMRRKVRPFSSSRAELLSDLHELDKEKISEFQRMLQSFPLPDEFIAQSPVCYQHLLEDLDDQSIVDAGSLFEGSSFCRRFKDPKCIVETDELSIIAEVNQEDRDHLFGGVPGLKGWYWVKDDIFSWFQLKEDNCENMTERKEQYMTISDNLRLYVYLYRMGLVLRCSTTGPSCEANLSVGDTYASFDTVMAVKLNFWPAEAEDWPDRQRFHSWPRPEDINDAISHPCFLVHKPSAPGPEHEWEWYISFTFAEQILSRRRTEGMKMTYSFFKTIFYTVFKANVNVGTGNELGSYLAKTTMFWACERKDPKWWCHENLTKNLSYLLKLLSIFMEREILPHYFIPAINLLRNVPSEDLEKSVIELQSVIADPLSALPDEDKIRCEIKNTIEKTKQHQRLNILAKEYFLHKGWPSREPKECTIRNSADFINTRVLNMLNDSLKISPTSPLTIQECMIAVTRQYFETGVYPQYTGPKRYLWPLRLLEMNDSLRPFKCSVRLLYYMVAFVYWFAEKVSNRTTRLRLTGFWVVPIAVAYSCLSIWMEVALYKCLLYVCMYALFEHLLKYGSLHEFSYLLCRFVISSLCLFEESLIDLAVWHYSDVLIARSVFFYLYLIGLFCVSIVTRGHRCYVTYVMMILMYLGIIETYYAYVISFIFLDLGIIMFRTMRTSLDHSVYYSWVYYLYLCYLCIYRILDHIAIPVETIY